MGYAINAAYKHLCLNWKALKVHTLCNLYDGQRKWWFALIALPLIQSCPKGCSACDSPGSLTDQCEPADVFRPDVGSKHMPYVDGILFPICAFTVFYNVHHRHQTEASVKKKKNLNQQQVPLHVRFIGSLGGPWFAEWSKVASYPFYKGCDGPSDSFVIGCPGTGQHF